MATSAVSVSNGVFSWRLQEWYAGDNKTSEKLKKKNALKQDISLKILSKVPDLNSPRKGFDEAVNLKDITLEVHPGELVAIVGAVGSGKSSLLLALLGEMEVCQSESSGFIDL